MSVKTMLITRPQEEQASTHAAYDGAGIRTHACPMLQAHYTQSPVSVTAETLCIITSANAARALPYASIPSSTPILAIGPYSQAVAQTHGYSSTMPDTPGYIPCAADFLDYITQHYPKNQKLLHLRPQHTSGNLVKQLQQRGFTHIQAQIGYYMQTITHFPPHTIEALQAGKLSSVSFFSTRTLNIFLALSAQHQLQKTTSQMEAHMLSPLIAAAGTGHFAHISIAPYPTLEAMVALIP